MALPCMLPATRRGGSLAGALDAEDSAVLRWWIAADQERPVVLLLDEGNRRIGAYGPPTRLDRIVEQGSPPHRAAPRGAGASDARPERAWCGLTNGVSSRSGVSEDSVDPDPHEAPLELPKCDRDELSAAKRGPSTKSSPWRPSKFRARSPAPAADVPRRNRMVAHRVVPLFPRRKPPTERDVAQHRASGRFERRLAHVASELESARAPSRSPSWSDSS